MVLSQKTLNEISDQQIVKNLHALSDYFPVIKYDIQSASYYLDVRITISDVWLFCLVESSDWSMINLEY